jgi:hypothetical protein
MGCHVRSVGRRGVRSLESSEAKGVRLNRGFSEANVVRRSLVLGVGALAACSPMKSSEILEVEGVVYALPSGQVEARVRPGEGKPFIRVRPDGEIFDLIYYTRAKQMRNEAGQNVPLISRITDHPSPSPFRYSAFPAGVTVCRDDYPFYSCGLVIDDASVRWSVLFGRKHVADSEAIRAAAARVLRAYRENGGER